MNNAQRAAESALVNELRLTLARLELALAQISDGLVITDANGQLLWCNARFEEFLNKPRLLVLGQPLQLLLQSRLESPQVRVAGDHLFCLDIGQGGSVTTVMRREPLQVMQIDWQPVTSEQPPPFIFSLRDISDQISLEELRLRSQELVDQQLALAEQVVTCPVTGLPNRRGLSRAITEALQQLDGHQGWLALLFCDLNRFKEVNDSYGHRVGDQLLIELSRRMSQVLRHGDVLARLGGDEFVLLCTELAEPEQALRIAERLQDEVSQPWTPAGADDSLEILPQVSIGIALCRDSQRSADQLLHDADLAMYEAKALQERHIVVFDEAINAKLQRRVQLRETLQQTLRHRQLEMQFQPVVRLATADVVGYEALIRPLDCGGMPIPPLDFISVAEASGLISSLGQLVLHRSLSAARTLKLTDHGLALAVNISTQQLFKAGIAEELIAAAARFGVPTALLSIEITEDALIEQPQRTHAELAALRRAGFRVLLDDFGIGYSSLTWLADMPIDGLKIDHSFTATMVEDRRRRSLVAAILGLARDLQIDVIAEGIETCDQWRLLQDMGCELGQGYLFSHPLLASQIDQDPSALLPAAC